MKKITKALITAAGRGTRFLPVVKGYAKELVPVLNKPQIQYLIEEAIGAGITEICIVHRHGEKSLRNYFKPSTDWENYLNKIGKINCLDSLRTIHQKATIKFIPQSTRLPYGNASPLIAAKSFINNEPFVLMFGDDLIIEPKPGLYLKKMISTFQKYSPAIVVSVKDVGAAEISRYGSAKYIINSKIPNQICGMYEKLPASEAPSFFGQGGRFIVNATKIFPVLVKQSLSRDNELWFADAVNTLATTDVVITEATDKQSDWMTTGDPLRWLKANISVALSDPNFGPELKAFLNNQK